MVIAYRTAQEQTAFIFFHFFVRLDPRGIKRFDVSNLRRVVPRIGKIGYQGERFD